ncbi:hypothetical protein CEE69_07750 [Rhodopirellula bahusiensis]|uniref:Uncharacterized protein n=1 Tax=Rhodopirellula bahusiensis TaxID=2014065 RepID=A0A2G1WA28_9BACT|nr:hypothetical protein CEE69_07750 [Rhodopirellula bahusiensis]
MQAVDTKSNSTLRFTAVTLLVFSTAYTLALTALPAMHLVAASGVVLLVWLLFSDHRPITLALAGLPVLDLRRLIIVTIAAGIGAGLGIPSIDVAKHDRRSRGAHAVVAPNTPILTHDRNETGE